MKEFSDLIYLIKNAPLEFIKWLKNSADLDNIFKSSDVNGNNLLIHVLSSDNEKIHQAFFDILIDHSYLIFQENKEHLNALIYASLKARKRFFEKLIALDMDIDQATSCGYTALMFASSEGNLDIVRFLTSNKANPNIRDKFGDTALIKAVYKNHIHVVQLLLEHEADSNIKNFHGFNSLTLAAKKGHTEIVSRLLNSKISPSNLTNEEKNPLIIAAEYGHATILSKLIGTYNKLDISIDVKDKTEAGPLMWAVYNGHIEAVIILLKAGSKVNSKDIYGNTAVLWAIHRNHPKILALLINYDADIHVKDKNGNESIFWAIENEYIEIISILLNNGTDIKTINNNKENIFQASENKPNSLKLVNRFLVTADIKNNSIDNSLIDLRDKLLKTELMKLVKEIKELSLLKTNKKEFCEILYNRIKENIFAKADQINFKKNINNALGDLHDQIIEQEIDEKEEKTSIVGKLTSVIAKFFKSFALITANSYRNKVINNLAEDIKILVVVNVYQNISENFAKAMTNEDIDLTPQQTVFEKKQASMSR